MGLEKRGLTGVQGPLAGVSWIQQTSDRAVHKIVCVPADSLTPLETPDAYRHVPRRIFDGDGQIRPWSYG